MKRFPEFVTTFLSYYLASAAITALMMLTVFSFVIELFNNLTKDFYFIITSFLYYLLLIVIAFFYYPHRKRRNYRIITITTVIVILLHKFLIGNFILNMLHYSISSIVLANIVVGYLLDKDNQKNAFINLIKIGSLIYAGESIWNSILYYQNINTHKTIYEFFLDKVHDLVILPFAYYISYLLAIYAFYLTYPLVINIRLKISGFEVIFDILKILLAPIGVIAILFALIFA